MIRRRMDFDHSPTMKRKNSKILLNDDGKKILRELSEKPLTEEASKRKTKTHSIWSAAVIPTIIDP
jgi:hypothetical protein